MADTYVIRAEGRRCWRCGGTGSIPMLSAPNLSSGSIAGACPACHGTGTQPPPEDEGGQDGR